MADFLSVLMQSPLFKGFDAPAVSAILDAQAAFPVSFKKGEVLLGEGEKTDRFGIVADGFLLIEQNDFWGNRNLVGRTPAGSLFAESFAFSQSPLMVRVVAQEDCVVYWLDHTRFLEPGKLPLAVWRTLVANLLDVLCSKNIRFSEKVSHMGQRTTRHKLLSYLSEESRKAKSASFEIPFRRQELADYLGVERSAMSACLGKLRDEGLLSFDKRHFLLKEVR